MVVYAGICSLHTGMRLSSLLVPALHLNVNMSPLPCLGTVLSHGYILCGFLPT